MTILTRDVDSSNLRTVTYDTEEGQLTVEFHNGSVYRYDEVRQRVFDELVEAGSAGRYFNANVKNVYSFTKVQ